MGAWLKEEHSVKEYGFDNREDALKLIEILDKQGWVNTQVNWRNSTFIVEFDKSYKQKLELK